MRPLHRLHIAAARYQVRRALAASALLCAAALAGCVTVKPQQRALLADPIMQLDSDTRAATQVRRAQRAREGSSFGTGAPGGGCGCN